MLEIAGRSKLRYKFGDFYRVTFLLRHDSSKRINLLAEQAIVLIFLKIEITKMGKVLNVWDQRV